jgi:hypothetical protein
MSSTYNHLRERRVENERGMEILIREEVEHQEWLEAAGYRSPTWRVLRALQSLLSAKQLQGESAVTAPPRQRKSSVLGKRARTIGLPVGRPGRRGKKGTWAKPSSVEKLNEARRSKGSLKQKEGGRMKHPIVKLM